MSQKQQKGAKSPNVSASGALELVGKGGKETKVEDIDIQQLAAMSGPIHNRINALKNEQLKLLQLEAKFYEELHELECKYAKLYDPIFEKRRKIVIGEYEPTEEETKWALDETEKDGKNGAAEESAAGGEKTEATPTKKESIVDESKLSESGKKLLNDLKEKFKVAEDEKGIPNFWLETLQAMRLTAELIQEHDEPVLSHLQDIRVKYFSDKPQGYTLEFEFSDNPYFTNKLLTKTYYLKTEVDPKDPFSFEGPDLEKTVGSKIDWKPGKNVTVKLIKKKLKPRNKKGVPKVVTKEEKQESFFSFFDTPKTKETPAAEGENNKQVALKSKNDHPDDDDEADDEDDDQIEAHMMLMADFETGQYIKDKIIPKAVLYYAGELDDGEDDYDDEYDEDDLDEDDDDDDDENEEEEDDDEDDDDDDDDDDDGGKGGKKHAGPKGGKKHGGHGHSHKPGTKCGGKPGEPTPSECKQN